MKQFLQKENPLRMINEAKLKLKLKAVEEEESKASEFKLLQQQKPSSDAADPVDPANE